MAPTNIFQSLRQQRTPEPEEAPVYQNTLQNQLRLIGTHIDANQMNRVTVIQVPGGLLVRGTGPDGTSDELLEFPNDAFEDFFEDALSNRKGRHRERLRIKSDLVPTSYADVLRAIGASLDRWMARSIVISEGPDGFYVSGMRLVDTALQSRYGTFEEFFTPVEIDGILASAYARRDESRS